MALTPGLARSLAAVRIRRGFEAGAYLRARIQLLNSYFQASGISACVVGVSGGVDSAVVLGLLHRASRVPGSPLKRIVAALLPMFVEAGATNQDLATARGREVADAFGAECATIDLSAPLAAAKNAVDTGSGIVGTPFSAGQLVSYMRTPALYYLAALLTQEGTTAVLCGTTNRDEGSYIGFFGKASDGMVDMQPISDLHKSEVYALAELLGVPESVRRAIPTGDTYDGRPDHEMIGAPYDFLELYESYLCMDADAQQELRARWDAADQDRFEHFRLRVEELHRKNTHKYLGGSPAVHLDILERAVPGGWTAASAAPGGLGTPAGEGFVGAFALDSALVETMLRAGIAGGPTEQLPGMGDSARIVDGLLTSEECRRLTDAVAATAREPVGQNGMKTGFDPGHDKVGSYRATAVDERLAQVLWSRLSGRIPLIRTMEDDTPTDWDGHRVWRAVGVSPVMRFIWYEESGMLVPHYDAGFDYRDGLRHTLMSVIIYLSADPSGAGGATRFIIDPQRHLPLGERTYEDWTRPAVDSEVLLSVAPRTGRALVFDHRLLHDGEVWHGATPRLLLRTDVIFERCGLTPGGGGPGPRARRAGPLHDALGVAPGAGRSAVDRAYAAPATTRAPAAERRTAWKLLRDPFYAAVYERLGTVEAVEEAGFFDDQGELESDDGPVSTPEFMATPLAKIERRLAAEHAREAAGEAPRPLVVLLSTGAFSPIHKGHVGMLEDARRALERRGHAVLGGYLSPSHDAYVDTKCGDQNPGAAHRIRLCAEAINDSDWMMVDPWEALHVDRAVNFTEVVDRLERYLSRHLATARPVHVAYVFGSDNARFALTFLERGHAVCVHRRGHEAAQRKYAQHPAVRGLSRVVMVRGTAPEAASSHVRSGDESVLRADVRDLWRHMQTRQKSERADDGFLLYLRDESAFSVSAWAARPGAGRLQAARHEFVAGLEQSLRDAFRTGDGASGLLLERLVLEDQRREVAEATDGERVLSMDPCLPGDANLGISRCFEPVSGGAMNGLVERPGWPSLERQLAAIPGGEYVLFDDDIATGSTMAYAQSILPPRVRIVRQLALTRVSPADGGAGRSDLCDLRDFMIGAREGGLVVALPDRTLARAPYVLPYVRPSQRTSVPLANEVEFSLAIWELNRRFFESLKSPLLVSDGSVGFRALAAYLGFAPNMPLAQVCAWHIERLLPARVARERFLDGRRSAGTSAA